MVSKRKPLTGEADYHLPAVKKAVSEFMLLVFVLIMVFGIKDEKKWEAYCRYVGVLYASLRGN